MKRMERVHQVDPAHPINRGVVDLRHHRKATGRIPFDRVEPFDHGEFPRRAVEIERTRVDTGGLNAQLAPIARLGKRDVAHVVFKVAPAAGASFWRAACGFRRIGGCL